MLEIKKTLEALGFGVEGYDLKNRGLRGEDVPLIAHLRDPEHYVVISKAAPSYVIALDGPNARRIWPMDAFEKRCTGAILRVRRLAEAIRSRVANGPGYLSFDTLIADAGDISRNQAEFEFRFSFVNVSEDPVSIINVMASCSCLRIDYPRASVPPGGRGQVILSYKIAPNAATFEQTAVVEAKGRSSQRVKLTATGSANSVVQCVPSIIRIPKLAGSTIERETFIRYTGDEPITIIACDTNIAGLSIVAQPVTEEVLRQRLPGANTAPMRSLGPRVWVVRVVTHDPIDVLSVFKPAVRCRTNIPGFEEVVVPIEVVNF